MRKVLACAAAAAAVLVAVSCMSRKAPEGTAATSAAGAAEGTTAAPTEAKTTAPAAPEARGGAARVFAKIESKSGSRVKGRAEFTEADGTVTMTLEVTGLTPGEHAIHLHEKGDCSAPDATSAGGHWNPTGEAHGKWGTHPFHRGDVGMLVAGADGKATLTFTTDLWSLDGDPSRNVVGRAVVIHASPDDFKTQPTGNAGARVACGVVEKR